MCEAFGGVMPLGGLTMIPGLGSNMQFLQLGKAGLLEIVPPLMEGLRQWWSGVVESLPRTEHRIFPFQGSIDV